jgi:4-carboxymuconolactone decarboxylase
VRAFSLRRRSSGVLVSAGTLLVQLARRNVSSRLLDDQGESPWQFRQSRASVSSAAGSVSSRSTPRAANAVVDSLEDVAPDLGRYVVEFAYGEIYQRPVLDLRQRQLVTISALTTLGGAEPQLEVHINAGLNVGLTAREVVEAILHCIPYTGFPRVLNAIFVAKRVFEERDVDPLTDEAQADQILGARRER